MERELRIVAELFSRHEKEAEEIRAVKNLVSEYHRLKIENNQLKHNCNELAFGGKIYLDVDENLLR